MTHALLPLAACLLVFGGQGADRQTALSRDQAVPRSSAAISLSLRTRAANSARVKVIGSASWRMSQSLTADEATAVSMSTASLSTIGSGVSAGAQTPYQIAKSKAGIPASARVGTSGNERERRGVLTPSAT